MKVYNSIQKRLFRALTNEYCLWYELNRKYLDPADYANVLDDDEAMFENDFEDERIDVKTVADPQLASDQQRLAQSQVIMQFLNEPEINRHEAIRRVFEAANVRNIEAVLPQETQGQPSPMQQQQQAEQQMG
jgi:hypothetical protein